MIKNVFTGYLNSFFKFYYWIISKLWIIFEFIIFLNQFFFIFMFYIYLIIKTYNAAWIEGIKKEKLRINIKILFLITYKIILNGII